MWIDRGADCSLQSELRAIRYPSTAETTTLNKCVNNSLIKIEIILDFTAGSLGRLASLATLYNLVSGWDLVLGFGFWVFGDFEFL